MGACFVRCARQWYAPSEHTKGAAASFVLISTFQKRRVRQPASISYGAYSPSSVIRRIVFCADGA